MKNHLIELAESVLTIMKSSEPSKVSNVRKQLFEAIVNCQNKDEIHQLSIHLHQTVNGFRKTSGELLEE